MGHHDVGDGFAFECGFDVFDMLFDHRTGVDHGDFTLADHIRVGADMGEGTRILRNDASDARGDLRGDAVFEWHLFAERYLG